MYWTVQSGSPLIIHSNLLLWALKHVMKGGKHHQPQFTSEKEDAGGDKMMSKAGYYVSTEMKI